MKDRSRREFQTLLQTVGEFLSRADDLRSMIKSGVAPGAADPLLATLDDLQHAGERAITRALRSAWELSIAIAQDEQADIAALGGANRQGEIDAIQRVILEMVTLRDD